MKAERSDAKGSSDGLKALHPTPPAPPARPPRVMVVDDIEDARIVLAAPLRFAGFDVVEAASGSEAVEKARTSPPDLILLDLSMPEMDGLEVMRRLKRDPATRSIPVLITTAYSIPRYRDLAQEGGCAGFLVKPIAMDELRDEVRRILAARREACSAS
jgi:CheY-like chemotaxis protein